MDHAYARKSVSPRTGQIDIDDWKFWLPEDWSLDETGDAGVPYFESNDGMKGCYVNSIILSIDNSRVPADAAANIQRIQRQAMERSATSNWRVMREQSAASDDAAASTLDLLDEGNSYRVLSMVLVRHDLAFQLALHDYYCLDYAASARYFLPIVESLRPR